MKDEFKREKVGFMEVNGKEVEIRKYINYLSQNSVTFTVNSMYGTGDGEDLKFGLKFTKEPYLEIENKGEIIRRSMNIIVGKIMSGQSAYPGFAIKLSKDDLDKFSQCVEWLKNDDLSGVDEWFDYWDSLPFIEGSC